MKFYHYQMNFEDIGDMNAESEKLAADYIQKTFGHQFVFITDFSAKKRAFYHKNTVMKFYVNKQKRKV